MEKEWITYLLANNTNKELIGLVNTFTILLPFSGAIDPTPAMERVNMAAVTADLLTYESFLRKHKVDNFFEGEEK